MNIEDTTPIDALAARVWGGSKWYYPHIERMVADMKALRAENTRLREAMENIAKQRTVSEWDKFAESEGLDSDDADYTGAYDMIVRTARSAVKEPA